MGREITAAERRWTLIFAAAVMMITTLPYLFAYQAQGEGWRFTGFVFAVEDGNSYIAKMQSGASGAWLFRTPYTAVAQRGVIMFLPYLLLGKLAAAPGLHDQLVVLYHVFRIAAGVLSVLATYDFLAVFIKDISLRRFGTTLAVLGGGLGWLLILAGQAQWGGSLPLEFYSPETFGFLGLYGLPHLALARALVLWALAGYLQVDGYSGDTVPPAKNWPVLALCLGLAWLAAGLAQPLALVIVGGVIGLHLAAMALWQLAGRRAIEVGWLRWQNALRLAVAAGLLPGLYLLYILRSLVTDPYLQQWSAQNTILSPSPLHYLFAYGLLLPFAALGAVRLVKDDPWRGWLPVAWCLALPALAYAPLNLQRRLPDGVWVALVILAMAAFERRETAVRAARPVSLYLLGAAFPSTLLLLVGGMLVWQVKTQPVYRPADEIAIFDYLAEHARPGTVVLAGYSTANALPAWAPVRVVIGHGPESAGLAALLPQVERFYSPAVGEQERYNFLHQWNVEYVIASPAQIQGGPLGKIPWLQQVHRQGDYVLYEVVIK